MTKSTVDGCLLPRLSEIILVDTVRHMIGDRIDPERNIERTKAFQQRILDTSGKQRCTVLLQYRSNVRREETSFHIVHALSA